MRPSVYLCRALASDLPALVAIDREASPAPWSLAHFEEELNCGGPLLLRGRMGVAAFCASLQIAGELHVRNIAVAAHWRRRGLGRLLVELTLRHAAHFGAQHVVLEVRESNLAGRALYESLGFDCTGRRAEGYSWPAETALLLHRSIP
jgi:ribosomal-protein-alanine N-acetyltransferase